jgi:hypothetical protein
MITFTTTILKYGSAAEKTGWNYIEIPETVIQQLGITSKKSCRVKGSIDSYVLKQTALIPIGNGVFIIPINNTIRKAIQKRMNDTVTIAIALDTSAFEMDEDFMACLADDALAVQHFNTIAPSHQRYFSKWIAQAKTADTKAKRIYQAVFGLHHKMDYGSMINYFKKQSL